MGADEAGTLTRMNALRNELLNPKVSEYGGRIVKTTGDGFLVEFASAVDAVQHAVDVQQALSRRNVDMPDDDCIKMRMGINLGDIIVQGEDIFGEGVNVAARLEALADPGGICISDMVRVGVGNRLAVEFTDLGQQSLKNIPEPVRVFRVELGGTAGAKTNASGAEAMFRRPAVAVLPFENISGDPDQEYFADGLTEDIITALSLWKSFPVIARNSAYAYKGKSPDIRQVGKELGARYVIEGSVRKSGDRVRVTAQLINAETGHHVWAERYDRELKDIFEVQDELTRTIAGIVAPTVESAERRRSKAKPPSNLDAWDCYLRGTSYLLEFTEQANNQARDMFERAMELDPDYSRAYSGLAFTYYRAVWLHSTDNREETVKKCLETARRAVELDKSDSYAYFVLSRALNVSGQHDEAVSAAEIAVETNPNYSQAHTSLGNCLVSAGRPEEGIPELELGIHLNPRDPRTDNMRVLLSCSYLLAQRYEEAVELARKASQTERNELDALLIMASALGHMNKPVDAKATLDKCRCLRPEFEANPWPMQFLSQSDKEHFLEGLRKAGWEG
jgi:adenylate cyclase